MQMSNEEIVSMIQHIWPSDRRMYSADAELPKLQRFALLVVESFATEIATLKTNETENLKAMLREFIALVDLACQNSPSAPGFHDRHQTWLLAARFAKEQAKCHVSSTKKQEDIDPLKQAIKKARGGDAPVPKQGYA
jgi:hypothetical protein